MTIAFIIKELPLYTTVQQDFFQHCFINIAANHPEHRFVFIVDKEATYQLPGGLNNAFLIPSGKKLTSIFRWKLFYGYTLPLVLKKNKVDLVANSGIACSLHIKLPQCILVDHLMFENKIPTTNSLAKYLNKKAGVFFNKAVAILTITAGINNAIVKTQSTVADKTHVISMGSDPTAQPIDWPERERIKETSANGKEYFLFSGSMANPHLLNLLKAFSFFKRRQKSNMQLLINAKDVSIDQPFTELLKSYKYRDDVQLLHGLSNEASAKILSAAYAVIDPDPNEIVNPALLNAMRAGVPFIAASTSIAAELSGGAVLPADPSVIEDLANNLMLVFKDEDRRNLLIEKGLEQSARYSWPATVSRFWNAIEAAGAK